MEPSGLATRTIPPVPIRMWQIWNEPNLEPYWPIQPFASDVRGAGSRRARRDQAGRPRRQGRARGNAELLVGLRCGDLRGAGCKPTGSTLSPCTRSPPSPQGVITILQRACGRMNRAGDDAQADDRDGGQLPFGAGQVVASSFGFETTEAGQAASSRSCCRCSAGAGRGSGSARLLPLHVAPAVDIRRRARPFELRGPVPLPHAQAVHDRAKPAYRARSARPRWRSRDAA